MFKSLKDLDRTIASGKYHPDWLKRWWLYLTRRSTSPLLIDGIVFKTGDTIQTVYPDGSIGPCGAIKCFELRQRYDFDIHEDGPLYWACWIKEGKREHICNIEFIQHVTFSGVAMQPATPARSVTHGTSICVCAVCGEGFKSNRAHARTCSPKCRKALSRKALTKTTAEIS